MWTNQVLMNLPKQESYCREDLYRAFQKEKADLTESTFRWSLYTLQQEQLLFRESYDTYRTVKPISKPEYRPVYSERALAVQAVLEELAPRVDFVLFESVLLNEFLNHQIAQNTIFIQVEKDVSSYVFDLLMGQYPGKVLYKPKKADLDRYWTRDCVVVLDLVSQSPMCTEAAHCMVGEKLLVDILADKSIAGTFSPAETVEIYRSFQECYQVDRRKLNRYAGRRGKAELARKYMGGE